jgi:hypothetical protein
VVLFGGDGGLEGSLGDTWTWDGGSWRKRFPAVAPSPRRGHVMAFDPRSGAVLLFGGEAGGELLADTWAWDGETWTAQSATGPAARTAAAAVTDPVSGDVVLVGGRVAGGVSDEVWRWRAGAWSQVDGGPPARAAHALAAVPHALGEPVELVLFGGVDASGAALGDTWTWDGESWTEHAGTSPSAREGAAMAALPGANVLVLFGGLAAGNALRDTWRWAAGAWSSVPSGDATSNPGMGNAPVGWSPHHGAVVTMRYAGDGYVLLAYRRDHWEQVAGSPPQGSPIALQATADGTLHLLTSRYSGGTIFEVWTLAADNTWVLAATAPFSAGGYGTPWPMSIDPTTGGLLLRSVSSAELWRLDGGTWTALGDVFGVGVGGAVFSLAATADGVVAGLYVGGSSVVARYDGDSVASLPDVPNVNALGADLTRGTLFGAVYVSGSDWDIWQRSADGDRRTSLGATTFAPEHVVFDPVADRARGLSQDLTWYGAPAEACVDATDGDGDGLAGCDDPTCWAICTPLCPPGMACDEQAPHCGDGTCSAIETCAACAVDCGACVGGTCGDGRCDPDEAAGDGCPGDCGAA